MNKPEEEYNLIDWWKKVVFSNYLNFNGRARRKEYWFFVLGNILLLMPLFVLAVSGNLIGESVLSSLAASFYTLLGVGTFLPGLAVTVRRLHDVNKSGWMLFIWLIPLGSLYILVLLLTDGDRDDNYYGPDPKNMEAPEFDFENAFP